MRCGLDVGGLALRYTLYAKHRLAVVGLYADAVLFSENDAFGIQNRCCRQLPVRRDGALAVSDDGYRALSIDDKASGELVVDVLDVDADFGGVVLILLEEAQQLFGTGRDRPERNLGAVDVDGRLICTAHGYH